MTIRTNTYTYNNKTYKSIAALCRDFGYEVPSKDYRRVKRRLLDLGYSVQEALEGREHIVRLPSSTKLNEHIVRQIREIRAEQGFSYSQLSKLYGVSRSTIQHIVNRNIWKHV